MPPVAAIASSTAVANRSMPLEVLQAIFEYVDFEDLPSCKTVSAQCPAGTYLAFCAKVKRLAQRSSATLAELEDCVRRYELFTSVHINGDRSQDSKETILARVACVEQLTQRQTTLTAELHSMIYASINAAVGVASQMKPHIPAEAHRQMLLSIADVVRLRPRFHEVSDRAFALMVDAHPYLAEPLTEPAQIRAKLLADIMCPPTPVRKMRQAD